MSDQINVFPDQGIFATYEDKLKNVSEMGKSIPVEDGIIIYVEAINQLPCFLTDSSCEGHRGRRNTTHQPNPYVGIGVLYNQTKWLEAFAMTIKSQFGNSVSLDFNCSREPNKELFEDPIEKFFIEKPFRVFLRLVVTDYRFFPELNDDELNPELIEAIQEFSLKMPTSETLIESQSKYQEDEISIIAKVQEYVQQLQRKTVQADTEVLKKQIGDILTAVNFKEVSVGEREASHGFPDAVRVAFTTSKSFSIGDFFRLFHAVVGGNGNNYCSIDMDGNGNVTKDIVIYNYDQSRIGVLKTFLQEWVQSPDGKLI